MSYKNLFLIEQIVLVFCDSLQVIFEQSIIHRIIRYIYRFQCNFVRSQLMNERLQSAENNYKMPHRQSSHSSRNSSSSKFLKRKPDAKKIMMGLPSKRKRENSINQYFVGGNHSVIQSQEPKHPSSDELITQSKFIVSKMIEGSTQKIEIDDSISMLGTARSQGNLFARKRDLEATINRVYQDVNKIGRGSLLSKNSDQAQQNDLLLQDLQERNTLGVKNRVNSKKSRTQFFNQYQLEGLSLENSGILSKQDTQQFKSTKECGDITLEYRRVKNQIQSLGKKNKWYEEQIEIYAEKQYLLSTQKRHLEEILKEKDKIIQKLQKEKIILISKLASNNDHQSLTLKEKIQVFQNSLRKQEQRNANLKQQNDFMQNELISKNEELIMVYDQYTDLQAKYKKQQKHARQQLQAMKNMVEKMKVKEQIQVNNSLAFGQTQKLRELVSKCQEEIKYLKIQNQCLLISKQQLLKSQNQNRKLRDERDYFKKKVMENIKRNSRQMKDFSRSDYSSIVLDLSQLSIQK